jgi:N-acyl-D-aspartate/D-glutamate deacylase
MTRSVLRNALVVDGSGRAAARTDVVVEDDVIRHVGKLDAVEPGADVVDLEGLVLAPGFIDIHTHYDAQLLWDPQLSSSAEHGVTTVVMGNCGFGIAPARPSDRTTLTRTLENVEGMSAEALDAGIPWTFESFPEYLDAIEALPKRLNVGALLGHTPLRTYVMGADAVERASTDDERAEMARLVDDAIEAGAIGFASSRSPSHDGAWGKPVPSRLADNAELREILAPLARHAAGILQTTPGPGLMLADIAQLSADLGRPATWTGLLTSVLEYGADYTGMEDLTLQPPTKVLDLQSSLPGEVWPQIACLPLVSQMSLRNPSSSLKRLPSFKVVLATPVADRREVYTDPAWQETARAEVNDAWKARWSKISVQETDSRPEWRNTPFDQLAARLRADPFDLMLDVALADDLGTRFRLVALNDNEAQLGELLRDPRTLLGLSDAGAQLNRTFDACFSTHLLSHWVRDKEVLELEQAVWRLTGQPAEVFRIPKRGAIRPGYFADLVAFDSAAIGVGEIERRWDFPAGADRLFAAGKGIEHLWINGTRVRADGVDVPHAGGTGALIRGGVRG